MEFTQEKERIYAQDPQGKMLAEVRFPTADGTAVINSTYVDDSLRGQGVAAQLMAAAAARLRADGLKAVPTCSYAKRWFEEHPDQADLLR